MKNKVIKRGRCFLHSSLDSTDNARWEFEIEKVEDGGVKHVGVVILNLDTQRIKFHTPSVGDDYNFEAFKCKLLTLVNSINEFEEFFEDVRNGESITEFVDRQWLNDESDGGIGFSSYVVFGKNKEHMFFSFADCNRAVRYNFGNEKETMPYDIEDEKWNMKTIIAVKKVLVKAIGDINHVVITNGLNQN